MPPQMLADHAKGKIKKACVGGNKKPKGSVGEFVSMMAKKRFVTPDATLKRAGGEPTGAAARGTSTLATLWMRTSLRTRHLLEHT